MFLAVPAYLPNTNDEKNKIAEQQKHSHYLEPKDNAGDGPGVKTFESADADLAFFRLVLHQVIGVNRASES